MACGDGCNNSAFSGLISQFARCPVADGACRRLRWFTGQSNDLGPLLGAKGRRGTGPRSILQAFRDGAAGAFEPVTAPAPDRGARDSEAAGDVGCRETLCQQKDHLRPEAEVLGRLVGTAQRVERVALLL